jgi:hypothetical protein
LPDSANSSRETSDTVVTVYSSTQVPGGAGSLAKLKPPFASTTKLPEGISAYSASRSTLESCCEITKRGQSSGVCAALATNDADGAKLASVATLNSGAVMVARGKVCS